MRTAAEMSTATPRRTIPPPFSLGKELTELERRNVGCELEGEVGSFKIYVACLDFESGRPDTNRTVLPRTEILGGRTDEACLFHPG
jgi:hypothetical protein